ncbi:Crp/Fnr family transcriptional regulator [Pedobacter sp.]|uniref:Crp/Fnr family transcriptional regulator n=1 Tax=Pedobacter sp. TaxID=1411316 RepID=UPI003BA9B543
MNAREILKSHMSKNVDISDDKFEYFFSLFKLQHFKKKDSVVAFGEMVDKEYFVLDGCLKTFYVNDNLKMHILQFATATWWASDYSALYNNVRASVSVDCVADATTLYISSEDRERACREIHEVETFLRLRANKGYIGLQKRILSLLNNDARSRYEELIKQHPDLYNMVPKRLIASYLGVSRETLSRLYQT